MMERLHSIRETWLQAALQLTRTHLYATAGIDVPQATRVSVGFPGGGSARKRIGECWNPSASADQQTEIFVSPVLGDAIEVLAVLVHEAIHAAVGTACGHKGPFKRAAKLAGLEGKMTATHAGMELLAKFPVWLAELGAYPHGALTLTGRKKQGTRLVKCACPICGYTVRTTQKWLEFSGPPICSNNNVPMEVI